MARTRLQNIYYKMTQRCYNPNNIDYKNYGGRGIKICEDWNNYKNFYNWAISSGYTNKLTIDRIDVNKDYEPSNCRWITIEEQQRNKRSNKKIIWNGEEHCYSEWDEILGFPNGTVGQRMRRGWDIERVMTQQIGEIKYNYSRFPKVKVIFPNKEEKIYNSFLEASKDMNMSVKTLHSLETEEGRVKSRKYRGYKIEKLDG